MKSNQIIHILAIILVGCLMGCNQMEYVDEPNLETSTPHAGYQPNVSRAEDYPYSLEEIILLYSRTEREGSFYYLNMTATEAVNEGIREQTFNYYNDELKKTNEVLSDLSNQEAIIEYADYKEVANKLRKDGFSTEVEELINSELIESRSGNGSFRSSGHIETMSQEFGEDFCDLPMKFSHIRFTCWSRVAPTPIYVCKTFSLGNWTVKSVLGGIGMLTQVDVAPVATCVIVGVCFATSDLHGGICNWSAVGIE
ncbi:MAG: hypothetical protein K2K40_04920 [Paramuribaculum sp.]|nr:hypothetical protein [Paramuribaculum sp.]